MTDELIRGSHWPPERRDGNFQRRSFELLESAIRSVPRDKLHPMNLSPMRVASVVLGAAPRFMALRPDMARMDSEINLWLVDHCPYLAHAYAYAATAWIPDNELSVQALRMEGVKLRKKLRTELKRLSLPGDGYGFLDELKNTMAYHAISGDLMKLHRAFRKRWAELGPLTRAVSEADVERAAILNYHLQTRERDWVRRARARKGPALVAHQAFTLLCLAYEEVRSAVALLRRREGDADEIAPSIYGPRKRAALAAESPVPTSSVRKRPSALRARPRV